MVAPGVVGPAVADLKAAVRAIANAYNHESDTHVTYYLDVIVECEQARAWNAAQRTWHAARRDQRAAAAR